MDIVIKNIDKETLSSHIGEFLRIIRDDPDEYWDMKHLMMDLPGKFESSLVALSENQIAGFIIASCKPESIHIHKFIVKSIFRSKGIGSILLQFLEVKVREQNYQKVTLNVYHSNSNAIRFYQKQGFVVEGERLDTVNNTLLLTMSKMISF